MDISDTESVEHERKFSTNTLNTDSGVSSLTNENEDMETEKEPTIDYRTIRSTGARVSIDTGRRRCGEFSRLIETSSRHRKSCSLPDILDLDNVCNIEENFDDLNKTCDSSDLNLSFEEPEDASVHPVRRVGLGALVPIQVCGKEHVEEPCFICMRDNEIYCSVCVEVGHVH